MNISKAGILLETHFPIEPGHTVQLTIGMEEDLLDIKGNPVHVKSLDGGKYQIGIQFVDLDENAADILQNFINSGGTEKQSKVKEGK